MIDQSPGAPQRPTRAKAAEMLKDGEVRGRPLTKAQRGFFGALVSGDDLRTPRPNITRRAARRSGR